MGHFQSIFVVLLIFLVLFGMLEFIKAFGAGKTGLHAIIAAVVALFFLVSKMAVNIVSFMVPWFMVIMIFLFFTMFFIRMFGAQEKHMFDLIKDPNVYPWLIIMIVLVLVVALGTNLGQGLLEQGQGIESPDIQPGIDYTGETGTQLQPATPGTSSTATDSWSTNVISTLRHPKVLGLLFVFLIAGISIIFLTKPSIPPG
ncbi:MAG: hypothetical protein KKF46_07460 [Nanoarchaeota archaeon]|nr:hypothetical protein [Nanoarchaeota archaeon]MBU1322164.1 hypothetical protein [Nanoarchaeota archaeon]MBU1597885.1 hypothetical protein [Nanoarchaeota archaeon]MBU2441304.1 hypothetical protein [Nanoarchaeota archaeon]